MALDWFPFYYKDFTLSKKVRRMTHEQKGAYLSLLIEAWSDPSCSLPIRSSELHTLINWTGSEKDFELVRACFSVHPEQPRKLHNARLYQEWKKAQQISESARASIRTRWDKRTLPAVPSQGPSRKLHDRESKGLTAIGSDVAAIADKHFPPI